MSYRVVYDVLDDVALPAREQGLYFLGFALIWTVAWFMVVRGIKARSPEKGPPMRAGLLIGGFFLCIGIGVVATETYPMFVDQKQCKEWARAGDHEVAEGRITGFVRDGVRSPPTRFRVGETRFTYRGSATRTGGFHGKFTASGSQDLKLQDGLAVRIAHRDGRILRIEIAE